MTTKKEALDRRIFEGKYRQELGLPSLEDEYTNYIDKHKLANRIYAAEKELIKQKEEIDAKLAAFDLVKQELGILRLPVKQPVGLSKVAMTKFSVVDGAEVENNTPKHGFEDILG